MLPAPKKTKRPDEGQTEVKRRKIEEGTPVGKEPGSGGASGAVEVVDFLPGRFPEISVKLVMDRVTGLVSRFQFEAGGDPGPRIAARHSAYNAFPRVERTQGTKKAPEERTKLTLKEVQGSLTSYKKSDGLTQMPWSNGAWRPTGTLSGPASKATTRDLQLLNHLSQALINVVHTTEIEAMAVNGRIVVSANEKVAVAKLLSLDLADTLLKTSGSTPWQQGKADKLGELLEALALGSRPADAQRDERARRGIRRLVQLGVDCSLEPQQTVAVKAILATLYRVVTDPGAARILDGGTPESDPASVIDLINNDRYAGCVIVVNGDTATAGVQSHAEQNLVHAALLAGRSGEQISIAGGKRPCTVCWMTLCLAREYSYDITFNTRAGGFWDGSTYRGLHRVAHALGVKNLQEWISTVTSGKDGQSGLAQYLTSPFSDAERNAVITDLPKMVLTTTKAVSDRLTQSFSEDLESPSPSQPSAGSATSDTDDIFIQEESEEIPTTSPKMEIVGAEDAAEPPYASAARAVLASIDLTGDDAVSTWLDPGLDAIDADADAEGSP